MARSLARLALAATLPALVLASAARAGERRWARVNFHAHAARGEVDDDGSETPLVLHRALAAAGFEASLHTPHCYACRGADALARYATLRARETQLAVPGLSIAVGQELTVADGPRYARRTHVLGRSAPGNLNHVTLVGNREPVPFHTPLAAACERVHRDGGLCIVNHPGPGPWMWEEGLWEAPELRRHLDAVEVYNGVALAGAGLEFEARYREATAYRGLGIKVAATTGADTHGPQSVAKARSRLASLAGPAARLLRLFLPSAAAPRPELDAATLALVDAAAGAPPTWPAVIAAVKARRTVATFALPGVTASLDGLGEVRATGEVALTLTLSRRLGEVTLYREGAAVQTWRDVDRVEWRERLAAPAAYVFCARDGAGRLTTSAVWYEPR